MLKTWNVIMGAPELREIINEHRPLDVTAAVRVAGARRSRCCTCSCSYGVKRRDVRVSWLLPLVWLVLTFSRCRHASLFAVTTVVAITAMWRHTRWALWLAAYRPDFYQPGSAESRPWWASVWLPVAVVLVALVLQAARVPVPVIGSGWATHDPNALAGRSARRAEGARAEAGRTEQAVQLRVHRRRVRDLPRAGVQGVRGRPVRGVRRSVAEGVRRRAAERRPRRWRSGRSEYGPFDFALTRTGTPFDDWFKASPAWKAEKVTPTATFYTRR